MSRSSIVDPELPPTSDSTAVEAAPVFGKLDRRFVTAALMLVMVLASMEQTVTSTAMPTIIGELHGIEHYSWVASIYLLAATVCMPLYGRLADAWGRKPVILVSVGLFAASSMLAATAHTMGQLIVYRGLQGLGAGGIMPVVLTILGDIFTLKERASVQGFFSAVWGAAALAGPALGALLVRTMGWRSIFFVNLPAGLLGLAVLVWKYRDREKPHSTDLDLPGVVSLAVACLTALALVSRVGPGGYSPLQLVLLILTCVGATAYFIVHESRTANPVMPPALMMKRAIGPTMIGSCLLGVGFLCLDTYVPLYVQYGRGGGVGAAAGVVTPVMLTWALSGIFAAPLVVRIGFRKTALLGCGLILIGFTGLLIGAITSAPIWVLTVLLAVTGFGFGPSSMAYILGAQGAVAWQQRGIITSGIMFFRTMGGAVGVGLLGMLFNVLIAPESARLRALGLDLSALMDSSKHASVSTTLVASGQKAISGALIWAFVAMLFFSLLQLAFTLLMTNQKSDHRVSRAEALESMAA